jgi:hypothetical protein
VSAPVTYAYQWWRTTPAGVATPIPGATAASYQVATADVGFTITCVITATNPGGSIQVTTTTTGTIGLADVIITSLTYPAGTIAAGTAVTFGAVVKNQGTIATPAGVVVGVTFAIDGVQVSASSSDKTALAPGASVALTASGTWPATTGTHTLLATVNSTDLFPESSTTNNTLSATLSVSSAPAQTRFVGYTMDVTNRGGMVGKNLTSADAITPRTCFPGGATAAANQSLPCNFESFTDYLAMAPWPPIIGCFMNQNDASGTNVAVLYFGAGAGTTTSQGGFPTYQGQLTNPSALTGAPFVGAPYKNPDGSAAIPAIPIISWDLGGTSLAAIAAGNFDTNTLIPAANACKAWPASNPGNPAFGSQPGGQVIIRFCHEMNGSWSGYSPGCTVAVNGPFGGQPSGTTCAQFVAMWRHVVEVFAAQGATNVRWLWCPNVMGSAAATPSQSGWSSGSGTTALLYPGDAYVDYVGLDGYNYTNNSPNWQTFAKVFQASYNIIYNGDSFTKIPGASTAGPITTTKPMILGEIGCWETDEMHNIPAGQNKGQWFRDIITAAADNGTMPNIVGVCYWYENPGSAGNQTSLEYYISSSASSVSGWNALQTAWAGGRPAVMAGVTASH